MGEMFLVICIEVENEKIKWEFIDSNMPIKLHMTYELTNMKERLVKVYL